MTLIEWRPQGGRARSFHVSGTAAAVLLLIIKANVTSGTHVMTDEAGRYAHLNMHFAAHDFITHSTGEYVRGDVHTRPCGQTGPGAGAARAAWAVQH
jgi:hypothetical protein